MLIFLDIDGVLVPAAAWKTPPNLEDGFPMFSQKAIKALQQLISEKTTIILSTSHRDRFTIDEWKSIFKKRGLNVNKLNRLDSNHSLKKRKEEIIGWFDVHNNDENFVIIDDDNTLNALPGHLKDHLILTSSLVGFTSEHIPQVEAIIGKGL